jgi:hypothetical protein
VSINKRNMDVKICFFFIYNKEIMPVQEIIITARKYQRTPTVHGTQKQSALLVKMVDCRNENWFVRKYLVEIYNSYLKHSTWILFNKIRDSTICMFCDILLMASWRMKYGFCAVELQRNVLISEPGCSSVEYTISKCLLFNDATSFIDFIRFWRWCIAHRITVLF